MDSFCKIAVRFIPVCAALPLAACANYPAVATLSSAMQKSVSSWRPYTDDFATSCRRSLAYDPRIGTPTDPCLPQVAVQSQLNDVITILDNYFGALTAVADAANFSLDPGLDELGGAARGAGLDAGKADAINALSKVLAKIATSGIQRRSLDALVSRAHDASEAIDAVEHVISTDYALELHNESQFWSTNAIILAARSSLIVPPPCLAPRLNWATSPGASTTGLLLFQRYYVDGCNAILGRQAALGAFHDSAEQVKEGLEKLAETRTKLKSHEAIAALFDQTKDLFVKAQAVRAAFQTNTTK